MGFRAFFLVMALALVGACVLEDTPVDGGTGGTAGGAGGTGGTGGSSGTGGTGGTGGVGGVGGDICGGCTTPTPVCNEDTTECVECTPEEASFCEATTPVCDADTFACVQCTVDDTDACLDPTPVCDTDTLTCVGCLENLDCPRPDASRCELTTLTCEGCATDADCTQIAGLPRCAQNTCVECRPATEVQDCGGNSCNPATFTCTTTPVASRETCETCVSDSECEEPSNRCIEMDYDGARFPDGQTGFCMKTTTGGCERPYSITLTARPSLSGPPLEDYCGINETLATCFAVRALLEDERCTDGLDEECPQPSGLCRQVGNLQNRCTYGCSGVAQCDNEPNPGATCGAPIGAEPNYCGG